MKCWSRSTLGVVVGILNVVAAIGCAIYVAINITILNTTDMKDIAKIRIILSMIIVLFLTLAIISGLFVLGIIKRLHKLMMPWLILNVIGFVFNCGRFMLELFDALISDVPFLGVLIILLSGVIGIGIAALILWPIYTLFGDIRKKNIEGPGKKMIEAEIAYKSAVNY